MKLSYTDEDLDTQQKRKTKPDKPEVMSIRIVKPCNNPRFVIGDLNGFKVYVACPSKFSQQIIGKSVNVRVTKTGDETTYQYEP